MTYQAQMESNRDNKNMMLGIANQYFESCLKVDIQNEICLESHAHTLLAQGQFNAAVQHYMKCLGVNKNNNRCINGLQEAQANSNLQTSALAQFAQKISQDPHNAMLRYAYSQALYEHGMDNEATIQCGHAAKLNPKLCAAHYSLAMHFKQLYNGVLAGKNCRAFLECDSEHKLKSHIEDCKQVLVAIQ